MSFARCLQAQEGGAIQTRAEKVINIGNVMCINCLQISPTVRSVSARAWMLVAMLFRCYGAATAAAGREQIG
jgi:hypothetical protein